MNCIQKSKHKKEFNQLNHKLDDFKIITYLTENPMRSALKTVPMIAITITLSICLKNSG